MGGAMNKKLIVGFLLALGIVGMAGFRLYAQRLPSQDAAAAMQSLGGLEGSFSSLRSSLDKSTKELSQKLDQVLANQQAILKELEVVKVRASRK